MNIFQVMKSLLNFFKVIMPFKEEKWCVAEISGIFSFRSDQFHLENEINHIFEHFGRNKWTIKPNCFHVSLLLYARQIHFKLNMYRLKVTWCVNVCTWLILDLSYQNWSLLKGTLLTQVCNKNLWCFVRILISGFGFKAEMNELNINLCEDSAVLRLNSPWRFDYRVKTSFTSFGFKVKSRDKLNFLNSLLSLSSILFSRQLEWCSRICFCFMMILNFGWLSEILWQ